MFYKPLSIVRPPWGYIMKKKEVVRRKSYKHFRQSMPWGGETLSAWWQSALAYVVEQQVRLHETMATKKKR